MKNLVKLSSIAAVAIFAAVQTQATTLVTESFTYANGDLPTVSGGTWSLFSGGAGAADVQVTSGVANVSQLRTGDDAINLGGTFSTGTVLYACFEYTPLTLNQSTGNYFALFKDAGTSNFRDRIYITNGVAAGTVRLAVANSSGNGVAVINPTDLTLGTTYTVVTRLTIGTAFSSTLWINPGLETDPSVTATDALTVASIGITSFALRQSNAAPPGGIGVANIDGLDITTTWNELTCPGILVPEPSTIALVSLSMLGLFAIRRRRS